MGHWGRSLCGFYTALIRWPYSGDLEGLIRLIRPAVIRFLYGSYTARPPLAQLKGGVACAPPTLFGHVLVTIKKQAQGEGSGGKFAGSPLSLGHIIFELLFTAQVNSNQRQFRFHKKLFAKSALIRPRQLIKLPFCLADHDFLWVGN